MINKKASIIISSLLFSFLLRVKLTSFLNMEMILFLSFSVIEEIFHIGRGIVRTVTINANQANENKEELGSKTENKFVIILL